MSRAELSETSRVEGLHASHEPGLGIGQLRLGASGQPFLERGDDAGRLVEGISDRRREPDLEGARFEPAASAPV